MLGVLQEVCSCHLINIPVIPYKEPIKYRHLNALKHLMLEHNDVATVYYNIQQLKAAPSHHGVQQHNMLFLSRCKMHQTRHRTLH